MTWQARAHDLTNYKTTGNGIRRHRRAVRGLRGAGAVVLAAGLLVAAAAPGMTHAAAAGVGPVTPPGVPVTVVNQPFAAAGEAGLAAWSFGAAGSAVAPSIVQAGTTGWLALTHGPAVVPAGGTTPSTNGYAIFGQPVATAGLSIEFTYADTGGGALALMLLDASQQKPAFAAAALTDSLAGGTATGGTATGATVAGGTQIAPAFPLVGVGLDEVGAFSLPAAGNGAPGPGLAPESVTVRAGGTGIQGFRYVAGQAIAGVSAGTAVDNVTEAGGRRRVRVVLGTDGLQVSMLLGSVWVPVLGPVAVPALAAAGPVQVGFAAVRGPAAPVGGGQHDIGDVVINTAAPPAPPVTVPKPKVPVTVAATTTVPPTTTTVPPTTTTPPTTAATTVAPTTTPAPTTTVAPMTTVAPATGGPRPATPSAASLETATSHPPSSSGSAWARVSGGAAEAAGLLDIGGTVASGRVVAASGLPAGGVVAAQVSATGPIGVSVVAPPSAPGSSVDVPIRFTNTSTAPLAADMLAIVRPPDGVTLRPGATLGAGCVAVSSVLLQCTIPAAQLNPGVAVTLLVPMSVSASAPTGAVLPNGTVIVSIGTSASSGPPFALIMTTTGAIVATSGATVATTVVGATTTTVPGSLAFTGASVGTTTNRALLLIGVGVLLVLISLAWRPRHEASTGPDGGASA